MALSPRRSPALPARVFVAAVAAAALLAAAHALAVPESGEEGERREIASSFGHAVQVLAGDEMEGRGLGTAGLAKAADWIENELRRIGLEPAFEGSYRQSFDVKVGVEMVQGNRLEGVSDDDWTPLGFSSSGGFSGEIAFVGYGIESEEIGYTELGGVDLQGKVALILRYEPQEKDEGSPFSGRKPSRWSAMRYKTLQARERGAEAVIFVTGPLQDEGEDRLPVLKNDGPESPAGIPVLQVKTSVAAGWLQQAGVDLGAFQKAVDRDLRPRSVGSTGVRVSGEVTLQATYEKTWNVAGRLAGRGELAGETIVVGAHYDHLGMGGERSMKPNVEEVHNGADDNASGTAGAIYIGDRLVGLLKDRPSHRSVIVALFSGEEVGLAGSGQFVKDPPVSMDRVVAMINLDMVGRLRDGELVALGSDSSPDWSPIIDAAAARVGDLTISSHGDGYGPSDQTSFYGAGVPVLHLFTGAHEEYHSPADDADTINADGGAAVVLFASEIVRELAEDPPRLAYARSTAAPTMEGDSRGYGAYLGTVPDFTAMDATEGGVLLSDVRTGGPADQAGIRGGDRIVSMAGTRIENLYDMTYALQDNKPGETIEVVVVREGEKVAMKATLGDRAAMRRAASGEGAPHGSPGGGPPPGEGDEKAEEAPGAGHPAAAGQDAPSGSPAEPGPPPGAGETAPAHPGGPPPGAGEPDGTPAVDPWYEGRPGADFVIGAGKPFSRSFEGEAHLSEIRQLTFGGENAEAYWSPDGRSLIYQATLRDGSCDQQYVMDLATGETAMVSSGKGRTTCGYYDWPEADRIVYSSTHDAGAECPPPPDHSQGYVWALYRGYEIYEAAPDGSQIRALTRSDGYDAEATWCHRGGKLVFTSDRDGDLELYAMDEAGNVQRLTDAPGYDGGAFYSPDCSEIVFRASRPEGEALEDYRRLLAQGLIRPGKLEIFIMDADGSNVRQITDNGAANFCPVFMADGSRILYASNAGPGGVREFDLFLVDKEGGEPRRITTAPGFDGFPQFSPDGRYLVWASNRADPSSHETNLFVARWQAD